MNSKKKILFVACRPPYPLDTGAKIRSYHILAGLCSKYEVDVVVFREEVHDKEWQRTAVQLGIGKLIQLENPLINTSATGAMFLKAVLKQLPVTVLKYQSIQLLDTIRELIEEDYSLLHLEHMHLAWLLHHINTPGLLYSLDAHNVETQIAERMCDMEPSLIRKAALALHARNMQKFETHAFKNTHFIMTVSNEDQSLINLKAGSTTSVSLVENGVDVDYFRPEEICLTGERLNLVFVGSMDWLPNIDGVKWFAEESFPLIKEKYPECTFTVVGRNPHESIAELAQRFAGIHITGTVDDVRPYVNKASVVVVPLRYGGGTRLKILEAFDMGKPVVSTTLGCEGIEYTNNEHLIRADTAEEIAVKCGELLSNHNLSNQIGNKARELALESYSWDSIIGTMLNSLEMHLDYLQKR